MPHRIFTLCSLLALHTLLATVAMAQEMSPRTDIWTPNGTVETVERYGGRVLIGGHFTAWGPNSGGSAAIDPVTAEPLAGFPLFNNLNVVIADGEGGWIAVDGARLAERAGGLADDRVRLLHMRGDGSVAISRIHRLGRNGAIWSLARSGDTIFLGGGFSSIDGHARRNAAAILLSTGQVLPWRPEPNATLFSIVPHDGLIYLAGSFDSLGSAPARWLARVTPDAGTLVPWSKPLPEHWISGQYRPPYKIIIEDGVLYTVVGAMNLATMEQTNWKPNPLLLETPGYPFFVADIAVSDGIIYTVGYFSSMNGQRRPGAAAFSAATGELLPWSPNSGWTHAMLVHNSPAIQNVVVVGGQAYFSGSFTSFDGVPAEHFAAVDLVGGAQVSWPARSLPFRVLVRRYSRNILHGDSRALFVSDGVYGSIGHDHLLRYGFAEIDAASGAVTSWDPRFTSPTYNLSPTGSNPTTEPVVRVNTFARNDSVLYVGGLFDSAAGQPRSHLCAFNLRTRELLPWAPRVSGYDVQKLAYADGVVYASGIFDSVDGTARRFAAAVDAVTGELLPWDPRLDTVVNAMAVDNGRVYLGGQFRSVAGVTRAGLAVLDATTGDLLDEGPPSPTNNTTINRIVLADSMIYLAGTGLGPEVTPVLTGLLRDGPGFGGYHRYSGELRWTPRFTVPTGVMTQAMYLENGRLTVMGIRLAKLSSESRTPDSTIRQVLTFDATTGAVLSYGSSYDVQPMGMHLRNDTLLAWGNFMSIDGVMMPSFAWLQPSSTVSVAENRLVSRANELRLYPNPASREVMIEIPEGATGSERVSIIDLLGNRVATAELSADGRGVIAIGSLPAGIYFVRCGDGVDGLWSSDR